MVARSLSGPIAVNEPIPQFDESNPDSLVSSRCAQSPSFVTFSFFFIFSSASRHLTSSSFYVNLTETVEHVQVIFSASHPVGSDLEVILTSPSGTKSVLAELRGFTEGLLFKLDG